MQPARGATRTSAFSESQVSHTSDIHYVHELIAALDRRLPQPERPDAMRIARQSAALRARAVRRLAELERELAFEPSSLDGPAVLHAPC
jgi:hypothetical protein